MFRLLALVFNLSLLAIFSAGNALAQPIFQNPSFEAGQAPTNQVVPGWYKCTGSPDIQPAPFYGVTHPPSNGQSYLGLHHQESVSAFFSNGLSTCNSFTFSFDISVVPINLPSNPYWVDNNQGNNPGYMCIYGGFTECDNAELLYTSPLITNVNSWQNITINLNPSQSYTYINFVPCQNPYGTYTYFGIDNITGAQEVPNATTYGDTVVCINGNIQLGVNGNFGNNATFQWSGPNNYTSTQQNPVVNGVGFNATGNYSVVVTDNGCVSAPAIMNVTVQNCQDSDNDGVVDSEDLDDDNDGIPDYIECGYGVNGQSFSLINGGFEDPLYPGTVVNFPDQSLVPGWSTTSSDPKIEIWSNNFNGVPAYEATQHAEINYVENSALYQDVQTTPGDNMLWYFAHRGRAGVDVMDLKIGPPGSPVSQGNFTTGNTAWSFYSGNYIVPAGQTTSRFQYEAISTFSGQPAVGNFLDNVGFIPTECTTDFDGDGIPNYLDLDSDNDGIYDLVEAGHGMPDANNDGVIDGPSSQFGANGLYSGVETNDQMDARLTYMVEDTDTDDNPNFVSADSDSDGCTDSDEALDNDPDEDGHPGTGSVSVDNDGVITSVPSYTTPIETNQGVYDYQDPNIHVCLCDIPDTTVQVSICNGNTYLAGGTQQSASGLYYDTLITPLGCDSVVITDLTVLDAPSDTVNAIVCFGQAHQLPGGSTVSTAGIYSDTLTDPNGCDSVVVTVLDILDIITLIIDTTTCQGDSILTGGTWKSQTGSYTDSLVTPQGCDSVVVTNLVVNPLPVANITTPGDLFVCPNSSIPLDAPAASSWLWSNTEGTQSISVSTGGDYWVEITDANGCEDRDTVTVLQSPPMDLNLVEDSVSCFGLADGSAEVTVSGGTPPFTYTWSDPNSQQTALASGLAAGTYTVTLTDSLNCSATQQALVGEPEELQVTIAGPDTICIGETATLQSAVTGGTPSYTYLWSNTALTASTQVSPLTSGAYTLTVADANLCTAMANYNLKVRAPLQITLGADQSICPRDTAVLTAQASGGDGNYIFTWPQLSLTGAGPHLVSPPADMAYTVIVSDGCDTPVDSGQTQVTLYPVPMAQFSFEPAEDCIPLQAFFEDESTIAGGNIASWNWEFGNGEVSATNNPYYTYTVDGTYNVSLTVVSDMGCESEMVSHTITAHPLPIAAFFSEPEIAQMNDPTIEFINKSTGAKENFWTFGDNDSSLLYSPSHFYTDTGWFQVVLIVTNEYGCKDTTEGLVYIQPSMTIYAPEAFTPTNSRNLNDHFYLKGTNIREMHLRIFDRWGEQLFVGKGLSPKWDGKDETGEVLKQDVYLYSAEVWGLNDEYMQLRGKVVLVR